MGTGHMEFAVPLTNKDNVKSASGGGVLKLRKGRSATLKRLTRKLNRQNASLKLKVKTRRGETTLGDLVNLVTKHLKKGGRIRLEGLGGAGRQTRAEGPGEDTLPP